MKSTSPLTNFVRLDKFCFGHYKFIYNISIGYLINERLEGIQKHQLLFRKINNQIQHSNLLFVDSIFPNILADIVIEVLQNKIKTFKEYCDLKDKRSFFDATFHKEYFQIKIKQYISKLLFSNISSVSKYNENVGVENIYYLKNKNGALEYFSIYEQNHLLDLLFNNLILKIDLSKSSLKVNYLSLNFYITFKE